MGELQGQVAVVTGASRGIGCAVAVALGQAGANVAINYFDELHEAPRAVEEIERAGSRAILVQGDVADPDAVQGLVDQAVSQFGRLDIAVSSAVYSDRQLFHEADMTGFRRTIDVTMWGAFHLLRSVTRQFLAQGGGGSVVLVSSPHAYIAIPQSMAYNMSKAAVDQMARTAAIELTSHKVRVNVIVPGWTDTPGERKFASDEMIERAGKKLPWGRLARPEEIARGVVFLCDPKSDYITGSSLLIDGGNTLPWWASRGSAVPQ